MSVAVDTTVRTYIYHGSQTIYCVESYNDVLDRVEASRSAAVANISEDSAQINNPFGGALVHCRMIIKDGDTEECLVVDGCFSAMHIVAMYRAHPDV